jgi:molecular chaperone DnaK
MAERAIGIDLGTSNSCVATARGSEVDVLPNAYGEHTSASVVAFAEDGSITVGNAARANIIHDPEHTVSSAKRLIGRYFFSEEVKKAQAICSYEIIEGPNHGVRIQVREEAFSLPEISAMVLREMKQLAETKLGEEVRQAVITVPAYFNDNQRQATKDAGKIAGLEVLRILNEPTAAALAYGFGKGLDQRVAVYDLGGGTFDISILEIGKDIFEVLSTCGDTFLGGDDFDDRIIDLVADEFVQREGINIRNDPYAFEKLKVAAEAAKCGLSVEDEVEIRIPDVMVGEDGASRSIERTIESQEFSSLVMDLIMRTFKVCDEALQQADLTVKDLDGVILVGGPTRLPVIRQAVSDYFQQEPRADVDPDEVVAMGAAIHANSLVNDGAESFLLDVTPLDLRIGVAGDMAEPVIERNTPVPIEQSRMFTTFSDYQETVDIRVYQGDHREASQNEMLGQFEFSGFKKARRGEVSIEVTFEINADGIVSVKACDPETGAQTQTSITLSSGLSDEELETILEENPAARVATGSPDEAAPAAAVAMPAPDQELAILRADDAVRDTDVLDASDLATAPAPDLSASDADDLEVLAEDEGDLLGDDDLETDLDPSLGAELESVAIPEDVVTPVAATPVAATPVAAAPVAPALSAPSAETLDTALDGRAIEIEEIEGETELELDTSPVTTIPVNPADPEEPLAPAGEVIVELCDDDVPLDLADGHASIELEATRVAEAAVVDSSELELVEEEVITGEPVVELEPAEAETVPEMVDVDGADAAKDVLFDRNNQNLSEGLEED